MPKLKKGFKVDRIKAGKDPSNLRKGKRAKPAETQVISANTSTSAAAARPKAIKFNATQMQEYITGFHVRKNQRRMYAMKKAKEDHRSSMNDERKKRRESRRQIYNKLSQFPISEDFRLSLPGDGMDSDDAFDEETGRANRQSYQGADEDTTVDVVVEDLEGLPGQSFGKIRALIDESDDDEDDEGADSVQDELAFPSVPMPSKVRLIRKKRK
ncbi:hypothetical protein DIPPA_08471 [Diplonema papillatum]|nr:hypothetical protein DIPPA_08471 [Diplonema papillatum]